METRTLPTTRGTKVNILHECRVNDVISITYGNTPQERICRVMKVRDTTTEPLSIKTLIRHPNTLRGRRLITCQDTDGKIRSFYVGVEKSARPIHPLRAAILYVIGKLPARIHTR